MTKKETATLVQSITKINHGTLVDASTTVWDFDQFQDVEWTAAAPRTLSIINMPSGVSYGILKYVGTSTPTLPGNSGCVYIDPSGTTIIGFYYDGAFKWSSDFQQGSSAPPATPLWQTLVLSTGNGLTNPSTGKYGTTAVVDWVSTGVATKVIEANQSGAIAMKYVNAQSINSLLNIGTNPAGSDYLTEALARIQIVSAAEGSTNYSYGGYAVNDYYILRRTMSGGTAVWTWEVSTDNLTTFTVLQTLVLTTTAKIYITGQVRTAGYFIDDAKGYNLTSA